LSHSVSATHTRDEIREQSSDLVLDTGPSQKHSLPPREVHGLEGVRHQTYDKQRKRQCMTTAEHSAFKIISALQLHCIQLRRTGVQCALHRPGTQSGNKDLYTRTHYSHRNIAATLTETPLDGSSNSRENLVERGLNAARRCIAERAKEVTQHWVDTIAKESIYGTEIR